MKKFVSQLCSISLLATSLNLAPVSAAFAQSSETTVIRDVMANYSLSMERAEGSIKSLSQAAIALSEQGVTATALLDYVVEGMEPAEAIAYRAAVEARLSVADADNMPVLLKEVSDQFSKGANYRGCAPFLVNTTWVMGITSLVFLVATFTEKNVSYAYQQEIDGLKLQKSDLEADINILIGEGVKPESYLIASIKKDISFMDEQLSQKQREHDKAAKNGKNYAIITGAAGAISVLGFMAGCGESNRYY